MVSLPQIGLHEKPIFLLNAQGYWDPLIALLDHIVAQGFADTSMKSHYIVVNDVYELAAGLSAALDV